jgi:hypothetical protein
MCSVLQSESVCVCVCVCACDVANCFYITSASYHYYHHNSKRLSVFKHFYLGNVSSLFCIVCTIIIIIIIIIIISLDLHASLVVVVRLSVKSL